mmetsp:Transcript_14045/g.26249  ORF Transcript_14045/g.26249 Transcript_14045/m.26249 type:complete len:87 (+) Transcript_14045:95-355(+)
MASVTTQAAKMIHNGLQAVVLVAFMSFVFSAVLRPEAVASPALKSQLADDKPQCVSSKTWLILPFAFLTGGLINIDGFASTAVLLM